MSSLSNQQFNTKTMTGISDTYSDNIICDTLEVINDFTVDDGAVITLPDNSLQDSYLSSNVALLNRNPQSFTGINTFTNDTNQSAIQYFISTGGNTSRTRMQQDNTGFSIVNQSAAQVIRLTTRSTLGGAIPAVQCANGNSVFLQGDVNNRLTLSGSLTPTISTQPPALSNDFSLVNTAWIVAKGYAQLSADQTFTGINTFNGNVNLKYPALLNVLDASLTRGLLIQNDNTNPGLTLFKGIGNSSRFNFLSNNSSGVATTNFYIFNGDTCYLQGASGLGIGMVGSAISVDGVTSFTSTTTPVITQAILLSDNSTKIPTTAWVKGQNYITSASLTPYALLSPSGTQIYTGIHQFPTQLTSDNSTRVATTAFVKNQNYALASDLSNYGLLAGSNTWTGTTNTFSNASLGNQISIRSTANAGASTISQVSNSLVISAVTNNTGAFTSTITLSTRSSVNGGVVILTGNSSNVTIGQNSTNTNISSTNLVVNGVTSFTSTTTPVITQTIATADDSTKIVTSEWVRLQNYALLSPSGTQIYTGIHQFPTQATSDNSTRVATTAYVKNQGYATTSSLSAYALLTPSANPQVFTGQQQFRSTLANLPVSLASSTGGIVGAGGLFVATSNGQYNSIVQSNDLVLLSSGTGLDSASAKLTLTTYASSPVGIHMDIGNMTFDGGIIRQNSPFNCGYSYIGTPVTVKGFYDIGYVWNIPYGSFTGVAFGTAVGTYNILTLAWDGSGNKRLGVWRVDVVIMITCTGAPLTKLSWNTTNATTMVITDTCVLASDAGVFGATGIQILRMSFTIDVVNLTTTYYLNSNLTGGSGLASNTTSNIKFTRIA